MDFNCNFNIQRVLMNMVFQGNIKPQHYKSQGKNYMHSFWYENGHILIVCSQSSIGKYILQILELIKKRKKKKMVICQTLIEVDYLLPYVKTGK